LSDSDMQELLQQLAMAEAAYKAQNAKYEFVREEKESVKKQIDEVTTASAQAIHAWRVELMERIEAEQKRVAEAVADNQALVTELEGKRYDAMVARNQAQRNLESIQRQVEQAKRAAASAAEWATLEKRWDLLTMGAPWREWAKDHQIEGAKKMTYEGRMILGDTMGLGKTLTSLIFIDMVEAATKDASPDNPVEFGSVKSNSATGY